MARNEQDREDLIAEATAMVTRAELQCASYPELVTVGFWKNGRFSIYFDQDPVYQFAADGKLRRAFVGGQLYRSQPPIMVRLNRTRSATETTLVRDELNEDEVRQLWFDMAELLARLHSDLCEGRYEVRRQVTVDCDVMERTTTSLEQILALSGDFLSNSINSRT
jgi:hypothetical protein